MVRGAYRIKEQLYSMLMVVLKSLNMNSSTVQTTKMTRLFLSADYAGIS